MIQDPAFPGIPYPLAKRADQPISLYGLSLFTFVLHFGTDATLTDDQIAWALAAGTRMIAVPRDTFDAIAYTRLVDAHRMLSATARRRQLARQTPVVVAGGVAPVGEPAGPMAPLSPLPETQPPAPTALVADHYDREPLVPVRDYIRSGGLWNRQPSQDDGVDF